MKNVKSNMRLFARDFLQIICQAFKLLPVKSNRIVFISHQYGSQYSDSPKYMSEYMMDKYKDKYEIIWILKKPKDHEHLKKMGIKTVRFYSFQNVYYSNTAKVLVTNVFGPYPYVIKRVDRIIIETTHGVAYKRLSSGTKSMRIMDNVDFALSGNKITSELVYRNNLSYKGVIIEEGLPRNDIFFKENAFVKVKVKRYFGINDDTGIVILMPTWRKDNNRQSVDIDFGRVLNILSKKTGQEWVFIVRLHHLSKIDISDIIDNFSGKVIDATNYPDPQELLLTSDLLITDYSSVVWDFALQEKPIVIYTPDLLSYKDTRGFNVPPDEWMLFTAKDERELYRVIEETPFDDLVNATKRHLEKFGSCESGESTRLICERIDKYCYTVR